MSDLILSTVLGSPKQKCKIYVQKLYYSSALSKIFRNLPERMKPQGLNSIVLLANVCS